MDSDWNNILKTVDKMNDLMKKISDFMGKLQNWHDSHRDEIERYIQAFADFGIWCHAIGLLEEKQIIFTDGLSFEKAKEFCACDDIENTVWNYYSEHNNFRLNILVERCKNKKYIAPVNVLFQQSVVAFHHGLYQLSCTGLFALMDNLLASISEIVYNQSYKLRFRAIEEKLNKRIELTDIDLRLFCIYSGIRSLQETTFGDSDFTKPEPMSIINRHWVLHGRTTREYKGIDVLKLLLSIDAIITLSELCDKPIIDAEPT